MKVRMIQANILNTFYSVYFGRLLSAPSFAMGNYSVNHGLFEEKKIQNCVYRIHSSVFDKILKRKIT